MFGQFNRFAALHFSLLDGLRFTDVFVFNVALGHDALQIHFALGGNLRFFRLAFFGRFLLGDAGFLLGAAYGDFALLLQFGVFFLAQNVQAGALGFQVFGFNRQIGILLDVVAFFAAHLDGFGEAGQTFRVKRVLRVEEFEIGLVEAGQRHRLQLQAVFIQIFGYELLHFLHKIHAFFMQFLHRHFRRHRTQRINEFAFHQFFQLVGRHGFHAQSLRRRGDALADRLHAHIKLGHYVHPHPVARNQRLFGGTAHFQTQRIHIHRNNLVQHRQHQRPAVHNHLLAAKAGTHERHFLSGAPVEACEDQAEYKQPDQNNARNAGDRNQSHGFSFLLLVSEQICE